METPPAPKKAKSKLCILSSLCSEGAYNYVAHSFTQRTFVYRSSTRSERATSGRGNRPLCGGLPAGLRAGRVRAARSVGTRVRAGLPGGAAAATLRVRACWIRRNGGLPGVYAHLHGAP